MCKVCDLYKWSINNGLKICNGGGGSYVVIGIDYNIEDDCYSCIIFFLVVWSISFFGL